MFSAYRFLKQRESEMTKKYTSESLVLATKKFLGENPELVKREIQKYLMSKKSNAEEEALRLAGVLYDQMLVAPGSSLATGPFYGMDTDEPQWEVEISLGSLRAKFLCGIDDDVVYMMADIGKDERKRVNGLLKVA